MTVAEKRSSLAKTESKVTSLTIGAQAARYYAKCARDRSLAEIYRDLMEEAKIIQTEVAKFVATGQRSIVDKYLSESQTEEAATIAADFEERLAVDEERLLTLIGLPKDGATCPRMSSDLSTEATTLATSSSNAEISSPLILRAQAEMALVEAETSRSRKDYFPRLVGLASAGYMNSTELGVPKQVYSVAVGLIIPLFEGFKTNSEVDENLARTMQKEKEVAATKLNLKETTLGLDEEIRSGLLRLDHLRHELELAETAFRVAKSRYVKASGTLVDLREALRNLGRIRTGKKETESLLLSASIEKGLLNGTLVEELSK